MSQQQQPRRAPPLPPRLPLWPPPPTPPPPPLRSPPPPPPRPPLLRLPHSERSHGVWVTHTLVPPRSPHLEVHMTHPRFEITTERTFGRVRCLYNI